MKKSIILMLAASQVQEEPVDPRIINDQVNALFKDFR